MKFVDRKEEIKRLKQVLNTEKLPFAKGHTIITKLFLKNPPAGSLTNVMLPDDLVKYQ